ncbi:MAG: PAS domain-containing sensor histidine kinase [Planctomycetes bacterium]|nr:PAS domain-containing sensor histidine kinase [Planctomycetota bacterium]
MILVWFIYGLAFFVLGLVILVYPKKDSKFDLAQHIWLVGVFGIVHGVNEWLEMFLEIGRPLPPDPTAYARILTLSGSFVFLVQFGITMLSRRARTRRLLRLIPFLLAGAWLAIFLASTPPKRLLMGDIWGRYLLCAPGAFLTAWALFSQITPLKAMSRRSVRRDLAIAATTFAVYGVLAGLCVKKADFFPAAILNYETFTLLTGLPVQVFRAAFAIIAAWSIIRVLDVFRWETREALRLSETRCATIASAMPVFLFMTAPDLVVTFVQGKGLEVLGRRPEQIQGRHILDAFPGGESLADHCRQALSGRKFAATVLMDGVPFEIYYCALKNRAGAITSVVGVAVDVSARMEAQRELDEYRRKIEKHAHEAAVGVLSATVARHVAEPLTVTQLVLERAVADLTGPEAQDALRSSIGRSLSELSKARETLNRFMEMTQPDAAAAEQPIGLYQIAKRTMSVFADSALRRKLTIAIKNMDAVPLLTVSPREMEQIFYHLIQRALDATDGRVEQKLTISCCAGERCIELLFCDTCGGIRTPPAGNGLSQVRVPTGSVSPVGGDPNRDTSRLGSRALLPAADDVDGLGLGVAVAKRIVAGHGGQITLETGPENATLRVRLPATRTY